MESIVIENYKRYCQRIELHKSFGYDVEKERNFIIEKSHPIKGNILEVGAGKGYFTLALAKEGYDFTSVDISEEELFFAKSNIKHFGFEKKVNFRVENAEKMSFDSKTFDVVFCVNVFHHLKNPLKTADELTRIISSTGKIILCDFSKEGLELVDKIHQSEGNKHQTSLFDVNYTARYLMNKGLKIEKARTVLQESIIAYHPVS